MAQTAERGQKDRILRIAARLFAERGYHAVGMAELCAAVQLGRGAIYHYIRGKEDLLYHIVRTYMAQLADMAQQASQTQPDPCHRLSLLGTQLITMIATHRDELTVCFRELHSLAEPRRSDVLAQHMRYEQVWRDMVAEGTRLGQFRPCDNVQIKAMLGMYYYSHLWLRPDAAMAPEQIAGQLNELALRMLAPESG